MVMSLSYKSQGTDSLQTTNILFLKRINYIHKKGLNLCNIFTEFEVKCLIHAHELAGYAEFLLSNFCDNQQSICLYKLTAIPAQMATYILKHVFQKSSYFNI
jgi:hypothetical protein